jgi:tape measure domain-containing protein
VSNKYEFLLVGKDKTGAAFKSANSNVNNFERQVKRAGAALIAAFSAGAIVRYADTYTLLQNRIKTVTDSQEELFETTNKLTRLAQETRSELTATTELYTKLSRATEELTVSDEELFTITEVINKAFQIQGATTAEAAGATLQLSQALASGVLRGQEFNSVSEQGTEILRAIGRELGKTVGELRAMSKQGLITADIVVSSLLNQADTIRDVYSETEATVSQSWQIFADSAVIAIGRIDQKIGGSSTLQSFLGALTTQFKILGNTATDIEIAENKISELSVAMERLAVRGAPTSLIREVADDIANLRSQIEFLQQNPETSLEDILEGFFDPLSTLSGDSSLDTILEDVFSPLSETAGGVGQEQAQAFAENTFASIKTAFADQAAFEKESGEISELLSDGLFSIDLDNLSLEQQEERDLYADHYQQLSDQATAYGQQRLVIQQALETGVFGVAASYANQTLGMIEGAAAEGSAAQKLAFLAQQGIALASVLINGEMASIAALAPPPIGLGPVAGAPYAAFIRGASYVSAGVIAAQTIGSFEGGGHIPNGPRSGGLDGRGGQLAMVHPNESIIDHNIGNKSGNSQPMQATMTVNINGNANDDIIVQLDRQRKKFGRMVQQVMKTPF